MTQHIKYPEEIKMDAIEKTIKPVFFMSVNGYFIGTPDEYISWHCVNGYEIRGHIEVSQLLGN